MNIKKTIVIVLSFLIPIILNNLINLSEGYFFNPVTSIFVDFLVITGAVGIITVQTYGTYKILEKL